MDKPTIGLILCQTKNKVMAGYALRDMSKPIGISEFELTKSLPKNLQSSLPTIEEIENELKSRKVKIGRFYPFHFWQSEYTYLKV